MVHPEVVITIVLMFMPVVAYAAYVRLVTVRRLRKKIDSLVDLAVARDAAATAPALAGTAPETDELRRIQQRLQVLERIAVEKENSLAREIEDLRATG